MLQSLIYFYIFWAADKDVLSDISDLNFVLISIILLLKYFLGLHITILSLMQVFLLFYFNYWGSIFLYLIFYLLMFFVCATTLIM